MKIKKIVVVGAGPAGMMAAIRASQLRQNVILIEKNISPGRKLLLSGKGRCNLTNACDLDLFLKKFFKNGQFLRDAFKKFFVQDLMRFFEERGLSLKVERQSRVFPVNDKAGAILEVLEKELKKNQVEIIYKSSLKDILVVSRQVKAALLSDARNIPAERIILATGGASYSFTGSTGEGIKIAEKLAHRVIPLRPGLVPLEVIQGYPRLLQGLTLKNIRIKFIYLRPKPSNASIFDKKEIVSQIGELLFTGTGISGPLVLTLSGQVADWFFENQLHPSQGRGAKKIYAEIDLKPALSEEQLEARLLRDFNLNSRKSFRNVLKDLLPKVMVDLFIDILKISPDKKANQVTVLERKSIISCLKKFRLDIRGTSPLEEGMVTRGGVSLADIDPRTMESRIVKGLYFAGEMIDLDADTGGFNLQAAFSTGYLAGESAALNPNCALENGEYS